MPAESARKFSELEAQAARLLNVFTEAGYEPVAPAILQPAEAFLDRIGESLRLRSYVFTDPDGQELCLRPDLTIPTCRLYLERNPSGGVPARYCYNGPAFRYQPSGEDAAHPREFRQAGVECFGEDQREKAEAEILSLAIRAVSVAGLADFRIRIGDLGLFDALLQACDMPPRWRARLRHRFWKPEGFRQELARLAMDPAEKMPETEAAWLRSLPLEDPKAAQAHVAARLADLDEPLIGLRNLSEITERLLEKAADLQDPPLSADTLRLIEGYLAIRGNVKAAGARVADLAEQAGIDLGAALKRFEARLDHFCRNDIDLQTITFEAEFGRDLAYYTGLVFQLEVPDLGPAGQIAGGGRYDTLLQSLGAPEPVPAVGCAIHTERLLAAVEGGEA